MRRFRIVAETNPDTLMLEGKSDLVVGKYDVMEFSVKAASRGNSEILLRVEPLSPGAPVKPTAEEDDKPPVEPAAEEDDKPPAMPAAEESDNWPRVYAVRVPIHVRHNRLHAVVMLTMAVLGIGTFVKAPELASGPLVEIIQLAGLSALFFAYGDLLHRFLKFRSEAVKLRLTSDQSKPQG